MQAKIVALPGGLNVRQMPTIGAPIVVSLRAGAPLYLLAEPASVAADGYTWQAVMLPDRRLGWCAQSIGGVVSLKDVIPVPVATSTRYGVHVLLGGASNNVVDMAKRLSAAGKKMGLVVVADDKKIANALPDFVEHVVFRQTTPMPHMPSYPADGAAAYAQGRVWFLDRKGWLDGLDPRIFVAFVNEANWAPTAPAFWDGLLDAVEAEAPGRKLALFSYSVGNPDDANGSSAEQKWATHKGNIVRGNARGDLMSLHVYSAPGTPAGQLTDPTQRSNFETRYRRLYAAVPFSQLAITEAAREFTRGKFDGIDATVAWMKALNAELSKDAYTVGAAAWTAGTGAGTWQDACLDSALPALEGLYLGRL